MGLTFQQWMMIAVCVGVSLLFLTLLWAAPMFISGVVVGLVAGLLAYPYLMGIR